MSWKIYSLLQNQFLYGENELEFSRKLQLRSIDLHQSPWTFSIFHPSLSLLPFTLVLTQTNGLPFLTSVLLSYVCNFTSLQAQQDQNNIWSPDLPPLRFSHLQSLQPMAIQRQSASLIISSMLEHHWKKEQPRNSWEIGEKTITQPKVVAHGKGYPFTGQCFKAGKICYVIKSHLRRDTTIRKHLIVIKQRWKKVERVWDWDNKNILCFMNRKLTCSV